MKILFVQKVKAFAGSEKYLTEIIPALIAKGFTCKFIYIIDPIDKEKLVPFRETLEKKGIPYECVESKSALNYKLLKQLSKIAKNGNYDLIHLHLIHSELWFSILKTFFRLKTTLVSTIHGFDEDFQAAYGFDPKKVTNTKYIRILKFCEKRISKYFAVSEGLRNLVVKGAIVPTEKITVINYGFDYPDYKTKSATNDKSTRNILVPGRLVPYKGQDMVLEILPKLIEKGHKLKVWIAGDPQGPYGQQLKEQVKKLSLGNTVDFLGHVSNIEDYYAAADMVVLPSKSEGFGLVLLEAFNFEKPVITFDVPAFNETIEHEKTGLITPAFDRDQLMVNMDRILTDPNFSKQLTKNAKKRLMDYYCLDRMVTETIHFYKNVKQ